MRMAHSLAKIILHVIFSTKNRERTITSSIRFKLYEYMAEVGRDMGCDVYRIGGVEDHVHLAISLSRTITISDFIKKIKTTSSVWIKEQGQEHHGFSWQIGLGVFSISFPHREALISYIDKQEEHHRGYSFQEEYREILKKNGIEIDEKYLWD